MEFVIVRSLSVFWLLFGKFLFVDNIDKDLTMLYDKWRRRNSEERNSVFLVHLNESFRWNLVETFPVNVCWNICFRTHSRRLLILNALNHTATILFHWQYLLFANVVLITMSHDSCDFDWNMGLNCMQSKKMTNTPHVVDDSRSASAIQTHRISNRNESEKII